MCWAPAERSAGALPGSRAGSGGAVAALSCGCMRPSHGVTAAESPQHLQQTPPFQGCHTFLVSCSLPGPQSSACPPRD